MNAMKHLGPRLRCHYAQIVGLYMPIGLVYTTTKHKEQRTKTLDRNNHKETHKMHKNEEQLTGEGFDK